MRIAHRAHDALARRKRVTLQGGMSEKSSATALRVTVRSLWRNAVTAGRQTSTNPTGLRGEPQADDRKRKACNGTEPCQRSASRNSPASGSLFRVDSGGLVANR